MAKFEIDTDSGTMRKIEDNSGCGTIFVFLLIIAALFGGDDDKSDKNSSSSNKNIAVEYWKGDLNSPIFISRDDGSMVTFKKNSARMTDKKTENGNKLVIFRGCEVNPNGSFKEYGYYGIFFDESKNYYYVVYPQTATFPNGKQIDVKNKYQQQVCKDMVTADYENGTISLNK